MNRAWWISWLVLWVMLLSPGCKEGAGTGVDDVDPEFVVNSYQAQMQDAASAASTYNGFIMAWQSSPEVGNGYNVYIRIFPDWP